MTANISVLSIGNELLDGRVVDTNSSWLGQTLRGHGLSLAGTITCSDDIDIIVSRINYLFEFSDVIITSGGLGPTTDDLTRQSVAKFAGTSLVEDLEAKNQIENYFVSRNRPMNPTNLRQAMKPKGAQIIPNPVGSAPGFWIKIEIAGRSKFIYSLPGVPAEFKEMFNEYVIHQIFQELGSVAGSFEAIYRVFGLPESEIGARIESVELPQSINVCYRTVFPEIEIILRTTDFGALNSAQAATIAAIGERYIVSKDASYGLDQLIMNLSLRAGYTLSVAESCTGGMLGEILTALPGSSKFFKGGIISYSNEIKTALLGVPTELLNKHGAVSSEVVEAMAKGCQKATDSTISISISGVAGPDGGSPEKPVGTFFVGVAFKDKVWTQKYFLSGTRERIRRYAAYSALELVKCSVFTQSQG